MFLGPLTPDATQPNAAAGKASALEKAEGGADFGAVFEPEKSAAPKQDAEEEINAAAQDAQPDDAGARRVLGALVEGAAQAESEHARPNVVEDEPPLEEGLALVVEPSAPLAKLASAAAAEPILEGPKPKEARALKEEAALEAPTSKLTPPNADDGEDARLRAPQEARPRVEAELHPVSAPSPTPQEARPAEAAQPASAVQQAPDAVEIAPPRFSAPDERASSTATRPEQAAAAQPATPAPENKTAPAQPAAEPAAKAPLAPSDNVTNAFTDRVDAPNKPAENTAAPAPQAAHLGDEADAKENLAAKNTAPAFEEAQQSLGEPKLDRKARANLDAPRPSPAALADAPKQAFQPSAPAPASQLGAQAEADGAAEDGAPIEPEALEPGAELAPQAEVDAPIEAPQRRANAAPQPTQRPEGFRLEAPGAEVKLTKTTAETVERDEPAPREAAAKEIAPAPAAPTGAPTSALTGAHSTAQSPTAQPAAPSAPPPQIAAQSAPQQPSAPQAASFVSAEAAIEQSRAVNTQLAAAIASAPGEHRLEVRLDPPELGGVEIEYNFEKDRVSIVMRAEREEALELMRRHGQDLVRELRQNGVDVDGVEFESARNRNQDSGQSGQNAGQGASQGGEHRERLARNGFEDGAAATRPQDEPDAPLIPTPSPRVTSAGMDLRL